MTYVFIFVDFLCLIPPNSRLVVEDERALDELLEGIRKLPKKDFLLATGDALTVFTVAVFVGDACDCGGAKKKMKKKSFLVFGMMDE